MIKSIVDYHHWSPNVIDEMFADDLDFKGLSYWYDEVVRVSEMNKPK